MIAHGNDPVLLREAFSGFPSGVAAIAARVNGDDHVLVASSFTVGVSLNPPLVMFAVQHTSTTWPVLRGAESLGISILGEQHATRVRQLVSADRAARLRDLPVHRTARGAILLKSAPTWLECSLWASYPAGDHDIVVLHVDELHTDFEHAPLLWHRSTFAKVS